MRYVKKHTTEFYELGEEYAFCTSRGIKVLPSAGGICTVGEISGPVHAVSWDLMVNWDAENEWVCKVWIKNDNAVDPGTVSDEILGAASKTR